MKTEGKKPLAGRIFLIVLIVFGLIFAGVNFMRYNEQKKKNDRTEEENAALAEANGSLQAEVDMPFEDYAEKVARGDLGYRKPDEVNYRSDYEE